ncbi:unnamed protein product [Chrysodeixis includens]|uniref:Uncharacterized protein n=1 Tax=Chrysodeixis includens TaxID=689277 RepID=A0A9N8KT85_CHRIL|nr:unnamed protein product [Chrysodeixis includens]
MERHPSTEDQEMVPVPSTAASPSPGPSVSEEDETSGRGDLGGAEPGPAVFLDPVPSGSGGEARCSSKSCSEAPQKNKRLQCTCGYSRIRKSELQCMKAKCLELKAQTDELMEKNILLARQSEKLQAVLLLLGVTADEFEEDIPEEELIPEEPEAE